MKLWLILFALSASPALPAKFDFRDAALRNTVLLISDAPLERTVGVTNYLTGWMEGDKGEFEVDVRSIETGLVAKDLKIRESFLASSDSPFAKIAFSKTAKGTEIQVTLKKQTHAAKGELKTQHLPKSEKTALRLGGNLMKVSLNFELDLSPWVKLSDSEAQIFDKKIQVSIDAVGTDAEPPSQIPVISAPKPK